MPETNAELYEALYPPPPPDPALTDPAYDDNSDLVEDEDGAGANVIEGDTVPPDTIEQTEPW